MKVYPTFAASWIPGLASDFDPDAAVRLGARWLADAARTSPAGPLVVMNGVKMADNPRLTPLRGRTFVSPQSRQPYTTGHAVLAVWAADRTLAVAERLARGGALCLIPGQTVNPAAWIARTGAVNLSAPEQPPSRLLALDPAVQKDLTYLLGFAGHNGFVGGDDKRVTVQTLRRLRAAGHALDADLIAAHAVASRETDAGGAARLREFVVGVNAGKQYRDSAGKI